MEAIHLARGTGRDARDGLMCGVGELWTSVFHPGSEFPFSPDRFSPIRVAGGLPCPWEEQVERC